MGINATLFAVKSTNADEVEHTIRLIADDAGIARAYREGMAGDELLWYSIKVAEDKALSAASKLSADLQRPVVCCMVFESAGYEGAFVFLKGKPHAAYALENQPALPAEIVSEDPIATAFRTLDFPAVNLAYITDDLLLNADLEQVTVWEVRPATPPSRWWQIWKK